MNRGVVQIGHDLMGDRKTIAQNGEHLTRRDAQFLHELVEFGEGFGGWNQDNVDLIKVALIEHVYCCRG